MRWLTWDDIDFQENLIHIRPKDDWKPKSKDQRQVPILPELIPYLLSLRRDSRWVVTMPISGQQPHAGQQLTRNALLKRLKRVLKKLRLKGHVHTFRHSFISYSISQGKAEAIVRTWVGHVDAKILRRYTHIHSKQSQEAMLSLSQVVKKPSDEMGGDTKKSA
ncbi:MAG: site-specific integrase [Gemmatales bacterium]